MPKLTDTRDMWENNIQNNNCMLIRLITETLPNLKIVNLFLLIEENYLLKFATLYTNYLLKFETIFLPLVDLDRTTRIICGNFDTKQIKITLKLKKCWRNTLAETSILKTSLRYLNDWTHNESQTMNTMHVSSSKDWMTDKK